uniref:alpha-glucosidase n=1 Tax=Dolopus genitalis TaxID=2488630 RepID=A0A3G5BIE7_DOLGE|nr:venom polypeptide [Dolopus genitalis]
MLRRKFCVILCVLPLALAGPLSHEQEDATVAGKGKEWWQTASFYQIYPRSFKDSDTDGIGDLQGITEKMHHLKDIGITATWLSPIFKSPMKDFGYDISDFKTIQEEYGTMEDFENMIKKAKELGIKIILDFVPNHTSDEHEWFQKSINKEPGYENVYVWHPGKKGLNPYRNDPPNNWLSVFRGSAWEWNEKRKEYYLHQFAKGQPDLNYRNPKVKEMMADVLKFWLQKGVYGFRIDAVPHVFECVGMPDEPRNNDVKDPEDWSFLQHTCTVDQPETIEMVYEWREIMDKFTQESEDKVPRIMMTEAYSSLDTLKKYYVSPDGKRQGAQIPFNFLLITELNGNSKAKDFQNVVEKWMKIVPEGKSANWVLGNHDQHRVATRYGVQKADVMNMILLSLPGAGVNYNGEEIAMTNVDISWEDTKDPAGCNAGKENYAKSSRDPERTPFQWSAEKNAGFSRGDKTWLPVAKNYTEVNVVKQEGIPRSTLNVYKQMQKLRKRAAFTDGGYEVKALSDDILAVVRTIGEKNSEAYLTLVNLGNAEGSVNVGSLKHLADSLKYEILTANSPHNAGDETKTDIKMMPYEGVVLSCRVP